MNGLVQGIGADSLCFYALSVLGEAKKPDYGERVKKKKKKKKVEFVFSDFQYSRKKKVFDEFEFKTFQVN